MKRQSRRLARRGMWAVAAAVLAMGVGRSGYPVAAAPRTESGDAGDVLITAVNEPDEILSSGDSNTLFTLRPPAGAACPGDSANDDWRVQSFIIPAADDPGTLRYGANRPEGEDQWALYSPGRTWINELTAENDAAGQPGLINAVGPLTFANVPAGRLSSGTYRMGIACSLMADTALYWDVEVVLSTDPDVMPGQLRWRTVAQAADAQSSNSDGTSGVVIGVSAVLLAALIGGAIIAKRRHGQTALKEKTT